MGDRGENATRGKGSSRRLVVVVAVAGERERQRVTGERETESKRERETRFEGASSAAVTRHHRRLEEKLSPSFHVPPPSKSSSSLPSCRRRFAREGETVRPRVVVGYHELSPSPEPATCSALLYHGLLQLYAQRIFM
ncbi:hypothetical protein PIB30_026708 [Stylosanthes scabra]|uniref:Uncharacterized protein n=1 Tax=Stylosanthes scabra TaxID=79078 RepID=A0ABU6SAW8_9FABA|nr:hypothetical protein [Stylosanthes scabra]